jgi:hypothetical protein
MVSTNNSNEVQFTTVYRKSNVYEGFMRLITVHQITPVSENATEFCLVSGV